MSHVLAGRTHAERTTYRPYAAVMVEVIKQRPLTLRVLPGVRAVKSGVYMAQLPESAIVCDDDGETVEASGTFYITVESIDPYHLLIDALNGNQPF